MSDTKNSIETNDIEMTLDAWKKAYPTYSMKIRHSRFLLNKIERHSPHFIKHLNKHSTNYLVSFSLIQKVGWQKDIYARGGLTQCEVTDDKGVKYSSEAVCSLSDAYVKNIGISYCLRDIYNQMNKIVK